MLIPKKEKTNTNRKGDFTSLKWHWDNGKVGIKQHQYTLTVACDIIWSMSDREIKIVESSQEVEAVLKSSVLKHWSSHTFKVMLWWTHHQSSFSVLKKKTWQSRFIHALHSDTGKLLTELCQICRELFLSTVNCLTENTERMKQSLTLSVVAYWRSQRRPAKKLKDKGKEQARYNFCLVVWLKEELNYIEM